MQAQAVRVIRQPEGLEVAEKPIPWDLQSYVHSWAGYSERTAGECVRRELPISRIVVIIEFGPPLQVFDLGSETHFAHYRGGFVAGLGDRFAICRHDGYQAGVQLNLTTRGARALFAMPLSEIAGRIVHLADLLPVEQRSLAERLGSTPDWNGRFAVVEALLRERIRTAPLACRKTAWALQQIEQRHGQLEIATLSRELGVSRKHLAALFHEGVGMTPKGYAGVVRFEQLVASIKQTAAPQWAELALRCGYSDQAHMIREVKRYAGVTPTELLSTFR